MLDLAIVFQFVSSKLEQKDAGLCMALSGFN
jgi:hypothetical protein